MTNFYFVWKELFAILVCLAIIVAAIRRGFLKNITRITRSWDANLILTQIFLLMLSDLFIDGSEIAAHGINERGMWAFASAGIGSMLSAMNLNLSALTVVHNVSWWLHMGILMFFMNYLPLSKHFHVITSFFNVLFAKSQPRGKLDKVDVEAAFENETPLGIETIRDFTWKDTLDLFTCTECGRCEYNCPAHLSGKLLSPKEIIIEMRDHAYAEVPVFSKPKEPQRIVTASVQTEELWLARDRLGIKPPHYGWPGNQFVFSSKLTALPPSHGLDLNRDALASYLRHGYVPTPQIVYPSINKLVPGHLYCIDTKTLTRSAPLPTQAYWTIQDHAIDSDISEQETEQTLLELLSEAVRDRLVADVPLGAFLSGGYDSSLVCTLMQEASDTRSYTLESKTY